MFQYINPLALFITESYIGGTSFMNAKLYEGQSATEVESTHNIIDLKRVDIILRV